MNALHAQVMSQASAFRECQRHIEDLDKMDRRNNIRLGGIPEAMQGEDVRYMTQAIFNNILGRPVEMPIKG